MCICNIKAALFPLKWAFFIRLSPKKSLKCEKAHVCKITACVFDFIKFYKILKNTEKISKINFKNYFLSSCFLSFSCSCSISFISSSKEADAVFVCCAGFAAGFAFGTGFFSGSGATVSSVEAASSRSCEALS